MELFHRAEALVASVLDREDPSEIRCHEMARAAGRVLGLPVQDGHFGLVEHSWLWTREPRGFMPQLIDVYSVGSLPIVQIVDMANCRTHRQSYRIGKERDDIRWDVVDRLVSEMSGQASILTTRIRV